MSEVKHTETPWHIVDRRDAPLRNIKIADANETFVAEIDGVPTRDRGLYNRKDHRSGWTDEQANAQDALAFSNAEFIVRAVNSHDALVAALHEAVNAAEYVVRVCEGDLEAGRDPSPTRRSAPNAALAECYAAMSFVNGARAALAAMEDSQ